MVYALIQVCIKFDVAYYQEKKGKMCWLRNYMQDLNRGKKIKE